MIQEAPARILVVDDEPDLELLIRQRFRHKIRNNEISFDFASNGVEKPSTLNLYRETLVKKLLAIASVVLMKYTAPYAATAQHSPAIASLPSP